MTTERSETPGGGRIRTRFEMLDERFRGTDGDAFLQRIFDDGRWVEGPAYSAAWDCLVFSDIPNDRVLRWDQHSRVVSLFRQPAGYTNGQTIDRRGRLISCEQGGRRVTRVEADGRRTVLADGFGTGRLNSPNDVVESADGSIWFTDPSYGIDSDYEGVRADREQTGCHVYRVSPQGDVEVVATDFDRPNGLAFSPSEEHLFVVDTRRRHIRRFSVDQGRLRDGEVFAECSAGSFDGMRFDDRGRLWAAAHDGLHCYDPDGTLLGKLHLPQTCSNLTFGGPKRNILYITATTAVYSIMVNFRGASYPGQAPSSHADG